MISWGALNELYGVIATSGLTLQLHPFLSFLADKLTQIWKETRLAAWAWQSWNVISEGTGCSGQQLSSVTVTSEQVAQCLSQCRGKTRSELHLNRTRERVNEGVKARLQWVFWTSKEIPNPNQFLFRSGPTCIGMLEVLPRHNADLLSLQLFLPFPCTLSYVCTLTELHVQKYVMHLRESSLYK